VIDHALFDDQHFAETDDWTVDAGVDVPYELTPVDADFVSHYDLIGCDPDEAGLWDMLHSEANYDGSYDEVGYGLPDTNPYVSA
jgi:hypothetical protein